jgi:hypothetical protein
MPNKIKYGLSQTSLQLWIDHNETVQNYLQRLNSNRLQAGQNIYLYCQWVAKITNGKFKAPLQILDLKNAQNSEAEKLLDKFMISPTNIPDSRKWLIINSVKAFYRTNYHQLQAEAGKFEYTTKRSQAVASKETCLKLFRKCTHPRDQALVMFATCTAIALETMSELCWSHFEDHWEKQNVPCLTLPSDILKGHGKGKYKGVQQITFLTPEAKAVLLDYRSWYAKSFNHTWQPTDHIFLNVKRFIHKPLKRAQIPRLMRRLSSQAGVKYRIHDGRSRLQTALENVGVSVNWVRKAKGRKVKAEESPYSKPAVEQLRAKYREALPDLEFLTTTHQTPQTPQQDFLNKFADILQKRPDISSKFEDFLLNL